jgi:putative peptide zinc metalloprotease protein
MYDCDLAVAVFPFTRQPDGDEIIVGRADTATFLALPVEAVEILDDLASGKSVGQVQEFYRARYGEVESFEEFIASMEGRGFLRFLPAGSTNLSASEVRRLFDGTSTSARRYHFVSFSQPLAKILFGRWALLLCAAILLVALLVVVVDPRIVPGWRALYFPRDRSLFAALTTVVGLFTLFLHEMAHLVSARALGVESRMGIGHRLWVLVAETDLTGLWAVPRRKRYLPFLAGALLDTLTASILILIIAANDRRLITLGDGLVRLARAIIFTMMLRLLWQCFLFVRTDFYYVIATMLKCKNLMADTEAFLRAQVARLMRRLPPIDQSHISAREMRVIHGYSVIWVAGRLLAIASLLLVSLPLGLKYCREMSATLTAGYSHGLYPFLDTLFLTVFSVGTAAAGAYLWIASMVKQRRISR